MRQKTILFVLALMIVLVWATQPAFAIRADPDHSITVSVGYVDNLQGYTRCFIYDPDISRYTMGGWVYYTSDSRGSRTIYWGKCWHKRANGDWVWQWVKNPITRQYIRFYLLKPGYIYYNSHSDR